VRHHGGHIELDWEVRNADSVRWRVLRSERGFSDSAEPPGGNGQTLVNESSDAFLADGGLDSRAHYFYTVFSQEQDGGWQRQVEAKVQPRDVLSWFHPQAQEIVDAEASLTQLPGGGGRFIGASLEQSHVKGWLRMGGD
jgi:hypothetical protein